MKNACGGLKIHTGVLNICIKLSTLMYELMWAYYEVFVLNGYR